MRTVRFENRGRGGFTATLRKNVNDYFKEQNISTKGDWKMVLKSVVMLSFYLAPFFVILFVPVYPWMIFPLAVIAGMGMAGTGMSVMHDAAHDTFSKKRWVNKFLSWSMYLIGGNVFNWKLQHNVLHHTYTNIEGFDEDIATKAVIRLSRHAPLKRFHRFQHFYALLLYSLMTLSKLVSDFTQLYKYNRSGLTREQNANPKMEYLKLVATKAVYLFAAIGVLMLASGISWWMILLAFLVMHSTASMIMSMIFQLAHVVEGAEQPLPSEAGHMENEWTIHELNTTMNFARGNRFLTWLIGGLNYQVEHHLFPNICHMHYRKISPIVERTAIEFGLSYNSNPSFGKAIRSHMRMLKTLGKA
ncbi:MAG TPA: acyl-CoA desaturase [Bacteroidia bacterium]|jgi:linoleoyl-CoA desaturase